MGAGVDEPDTGGVRTDKSKTGEIEKSGELQSLSCYSYGKGDIRHRDVNLKPGSGRALEGCPQGTRVTRKYLISVAR